MFFSNLRYLILAVTLFSTTSCYAEITGNIVDAETSQPIEGAVVLVEWTITKGLGFTYTESYKVIEVVSNKEGKITIAGNIVNPFVNPPHITVYKKGYVAWNNEYIFPDYKKRTDFKWKNRYVFRLERFKEGYSLIDHESFIDSTTHLSTKPESKKQFFKAYEEWEANEVIKERQERDGKKQK